MTDPREIANPQLYKYLGITEEGKADYVPTTYNDVKAKYQEYFPATTEPVALTKSEKAWAGLIIGMVGTTILIVAGFIDDPKMQAILFAVGGLVNTLGVRMGVFQVANSEVKL